MKKNTKQRILAVGAQLIHHKGFNHTGIKEILDEAHVPKGSFYFYFKNKEDLGLQVIDFFNRQFLDMAHETLSDKSIPPLKRLANRFDYFIQLFNQMDYSCGCPIGNLAQEMGDLNDAFSAKLKEAMDLIADSYKKVLLEAQNTNDISATIDIDETAAFIVSSWHGALIRMKVEKSAQPLESHKRFILNHILQT
jgi:TetR/AcrR family transcriptional regulator, transcriptional repressor for nem operon